MKMSKMKVVKITIMILTIHTLMSPLMVGMQVPMPKMKWVIAMMTLTLFSMVILMHIGILINMLPLNDESIV